jgi:molybdopterin-binding protein
VSTFRISEVADLMGVSADTVRRWTDGGRLDATRDHHGHRVVEGRALAEFARSLAENPEPGHVVAASARNRLRGIVTNVLRDKVMAQVEMQAGPHRIVSLMSREAADELGLEPGVLALASVKSTNVVIEIPEPG